MYKLQHLTVSKRVSGQMLDDKQH